MIKKIIFCFLLIFIFIGCIKKKPENNLHISGVINGLKKGTLYVQKNLDTTLIAIDTIVINGNSQFICDLKIESPEMYYLFLDRGVTNSLDNNIPFFAEAGNIYIETSLDHYLSDAKIKGSKNHDKYEEFKKVTSSFNDENLTLMEAKFRAFKNNHTEIIDSIEKKQEINIKRRYLYTTNFALNNTDLEIAPYLALSEISNINIKYLDTIQKTMSLKVAQSMYGKKLNAFFEKRKTLELKK